MKITNIEFKSRYYDLHSAAKLCRRHGLKKIRASSQRDIYFEVPRGRLKLRRGQGPYPMLVYYDRANIALARKATWAAAVYSDVTSKVVGSRKRASTIEEVLSYALGQHVQVRKHRTVFSGGPVIVNLDCVEGVGEFVEVEINAARAGSTARARRLVNLWRKRLGIHENSIVSESYADLVIRPRGLARRAS